MVYAQPRICPEEWGTQIPLEFWYTNGSLNLGQMTKASDSQLKKKRTCRFVDFTIPADRIELKKVKRNMST